MNIDYNYMCVFIHYIAVNMCNQVRDWANLVDLTSKYKEFGIYNMKQPLLCIKIMEKGLHNIIFRMITIKLTWPGDKSWNC